MRAAVALVLGLTGSLVAACGYSSSRLVSFPGVTTVAVVQFDNTTFRRDLEFRLTRAVAEEIRARTSWKIASPSTADVLLTGVITAGETRALADDRDLNPLVDRFRVYVDVRLVERSSGRVLRTWKIGDEQEFARGRFGESYEGSATDDLTRSLAERVVHGLETPIGSPDRAPPPPPRPEKR